MKAERSGGLRCRSGPQSDQPPLLVPVERQVGQAREADAAWQATIDCCSRDVGREKSERQSCADGALALVFAASEIVGALDLAVSDLSKPKTSERNRGDEAVARFRTDRPSSFRWIGVA